MIENEPRSIQLHPRGPLIAARSVRVLLRDFDDQIDVIDSRAGKLIDRKRAVGPLPHAEVWFGGGLHPPAAGG